MEQVTVIARELVGPAVLSPFNMCERMQPDWRRRLRTVFYGEKCADGFRKPED